MTLPQIQTIRSSLTPNQRKGKSYEIHLRYRGRDSTDDYVGQTRSSPPEFLALDLPGQPPRRPSPLPPFPLSSPHRNGPGFLQGQVMWDLW
jgi:hypothetical protein